MYFAEKMSDILPLRICRCEHCVYGRYFSEAVRPHEALDVANIIFSLVAYCPMKVITRLPADVVTEFFSYLSRITCDFCRASADESVCVF